MSLVGLWTTMQALPLPVVVGAGVALAIASNRTIHVRRVVPEPSGQRTRLGQGDRLRSSSQHAAPSHSACLPEEPQLPPFNPLSLHQPARSISFKIDSTQD